jgi:dihydrofolate reductase
MISIIASMSKNRVIGRDNTIPWHITEDYIRTRKITTGHPIIMGRKNFESMSSFKSLEGASGEKSNNIRLLPGRTNIIITRQNDYQVPGAVIAHSLEEAISLAQKAEGNDEIFIFGGASLYKESLEKKLVNKIYLTVIDEEVEGDVFFPEFSLKEWILIEEKRRVTKVNDKEIRYAYCVYSKKSLLKKSPNTM